MNIRRNVIGIFVLFAEFNDLIPHRCAPGILQDRCIQTCPFHLPEISLVIPPVTFILSPETVAAVTGDGSCKPPKIFYCDRNHAAYSIIFPVFCEVPTINILNIDYRTFSHYHNKAADKKGRDEVFSRRRKIPPAGLPFLDPARGYLI